MSTTMPRDLVIRRHVELATRHAVSLETYGQCVAETYLERTPEHERGVPFRALGRDPYATIRHNAQIVRRMLRMAEPSVRMPVEAEEAFVLSLPEPFRTECLRELAHRVGLLAAPERPRDCRVSALLAPANLMRETAEAIEALAPMLADGIIGPDDAPLAGRVLAELRDVEAHARSLAEQIARCTEAGAKAEVRS
jgi:hypothetical protein